MELQDHEKGFELMPSCKKTKKYRLDDLVCFVDEIDRRELDGDGVYIVVGLQSGVKLKSGWQQLEQITLLYDNGIVRTTADKIRHATTPFEKTIDFEAA